jgi:hypothetical protein
MCLAGEMQGDQSTHGNSGSGKLGRNAYANAGAMEARPLGRRPEVYYLSAFAAVDQCSPSNCVFN